MIILILFAFLAGIVTILSPCILPVLPIILTGAIGADKRKPLGIVVGFVASFTFFTVFLSTLVQLLGLSADVLRNLAIGIIFALGISLLIPQLQVYIEVLFSKLSSKMGSQKPHHGFWGGVLTGLSLGLVWAPCVGPILASVITLAATSQLSIVVFLITFAYSLGTAIPMFAIMIGGQRITAKLPNIMKYANKIQQVFGVLMIVVAAALYFNFDRQFQAWLLEKFPQYGAGLTAIENNKLVETQLDKLAGQKTSGNKGEAAPNRNFEGATKWLNSEPLTVDQLKGKVVLVDFWTYSCINCIRTLPYLTAWDEKYRDEGLVIIGVHSPEFEFEKSQANVEKAMKDFKINYPVVQDNDFAIWKSYSNRYWPAKYLIDAEGNIRYTHFGEGEYDTTESMIQQLLQEAGKAVDQELTSGEVRDFSQRITPETYLGLGRLEASTNSITQVGLQTFDYTQTLPQNRFSLDGVWDVQLEHLAASSNSKLKLNFKAKQVFLVITPGPNGGTVKTSLDGGVMPLIKAGTDVKESTIQLDTDRLYRIFSASEVEEHELELDFSNAPGAKVFAFTFG